MRPEMMPHDLPPYSAVYKYFQKWQRKGIWLKIHDQLREELRKLDGREPQSSPTGNRYAGRRKPHLEFHAGLRLAGDQPPWGQEVEV